MYPAYSGFVLDWVNSFVNNFTPVKRKINQVTFFIKYTSTMLVVVATFGRFWVLGVSDIFGYGSLSLTRFRLFFRITAQTVQH